MLCLFKITKAEGPRPCKHLVPVSWAFSQQVLCTKFRTSPPVARTPAHSSHTGELRAAQHSFHLIFLNKFFPVSKGISSQITNTKLNSSFHSKFISKDEFCSQINHWNTGWIHKKTLRIWIEFKGLAGYVSQEMLECGREGQEKPLQKIQIKELSLADKSGCKKDSPSLRSSGFWSCL